MIDLFIWNKNIQYTNNIHKCSWYLYEHFINSYIAVVCCLGVNIASPAVAGTFIGDGGVCPPGTECPFNSSYPTPCAPGKYAPMATTAACNDCPAGDLYYFFLGTVVFKY